MTKDTLTERIIGCCFEVHRKLGPGFPEKIYHNALTIALQNAGVQCEREKRFRVVFDGHRLGDFAVDVLVEEQVSVEVKAVTGVMPKAFEAQVLAYLKAAQLPVGLLVNVGNTSCQVRRLMRG